MATRTINDEAKESLERMQAFDIQTIPREKELGSELNFSAAIDPAVRLVNLYKRLAPIALEDLPQPAVKQIRDKANADYSLFKNALEFTSAQQNPKEVRDDIIKQIISAYDSSFQILHPYISYSLHRSADFQRLDSDARATMQAITDRASKIENILLDHEKEAKRVLDEIRAVAAEEGVTQQSIHFRTEANTHETEAENWRGRTIKFAWALGVYAVLSFFLHKIPFLAPESTYDAIQLAISKILVFSVIAYMLFLSARNFLSHKHNSIVNRHRQNALMTHRALIEAVNDTGIRDAVMVQAASCVFSPQSTGYTAGRGDNDNSFSPKSVVEILSRATPKGE